MALDTKEKRLSMINFGDGTNIHTLPEPNASIDFGDRLHLLDLYSGTADTVRVPYQPWMQRGPILAQ